MLTVLDADGAPVSSVLTFYFRDEVLPYYAGDAVAARDLAANDFKYWELMRRACERGLRVFDYGRSKREHRLVRLQEELGLRAGAAALRVRAPPRRRDTAEQPVEPEVQGDDRACGGACRSAWPTRSGRTSFAIWDSRDRMHVDPHIETRLLEASGKTRVPAVLVTLACAIWVFAWYWETTFSIVAIWERSETFAHGFVVVPIFAYLVWRDRGGARPPADSAVLARARRAGHRGVRLDRRRGGQRAGARAVRDRGDGPAAHLVGAGNRRASAARVSARVPVLRRPVRRVPGADA